jgi:glutamate synthase (NADPH/NADH) large chain
MATTGQEAVGSMGNDTPISALSDKPKLLYTYFKQNFAQVTNPPIDPIREELVMSLVSFIGPRPNLFDLEGLAPQAPRSAPADPHQRGPGEDPLRSATARQPLPVEDARHDLPVDQRRGGHGGGAAAQLCAVPRRRCASGTTSSSCRTAWSPGAGRSRRCSRCAAVHHHLIRKGLRTSVGLVVETGEAREVHHFCVLAGYGAEAINPYLAFETMSAMKGDLPRGGRRPGDRQALHQVDRQGHPQGDVQDGHLDLPVLLRRADLRRGRPVERFRREVLHRHRDPHRGRRPGRDRRGDGAAPHDAFGDDPTLKTTLDVGGEYAYRIRGEDHVWSPDTVAALQHAARGNSQDRYREFAG